MPETPNTGASILAEIIAAALAAAGQGADPVRAAGDDAARRTVTHDAAEAARRALAVAAGDPTHPGAALPVLCWRTVAAACAPQSTPTSTLAVVDRAAADLAAAGVPPLDRADYEAASRLASALAQAAERAQIMLHELAVDEARARRAVVNATALMQKREQERAREQTNANASKPAGPDLTVVVLGDDSPCTCPGCTAARERAGAAGNN